MESTRAEALARLATFVPFAGRTYRATRNEDRGPDDRTNVSTLAPYVRARLVTEEEVLRAVLARHSLRAAEKFTQEVFWRTYWKGWLEPRPAVWADYRRDLAIAYERVEGEPALSNAYQAAVRGLTAIPAFNAWAKELVELGYLHNHARMWFASIWTFTLRLPWELGADFFMRHLLCGDPAANTLSWRWVAGLHTRGRSYRATRDNIRRYTSDRLEPGTDLALRAEPLTGPLYAPQPLSQPSASFRAGERALLLLHDDDVGVETLALAGLDVAQSIGLVAAAGRSLRPLSAAALEFARGAVADGLQRAPHGEPAAIFDASDPSVTVEAVVRRARERGVSLVVAPYAPVGPVSGALANLRGALAAHDIRLETIVRAYDIFAWPHATRGFYNLKVKIPTILQSLGVCAEDDRDAPLKSAVTGDAPRPVPQHVHQ